MKTWSILLTALAILAASAAMIPAATASPSHHRVQVPAIANQRAQTVARERSNAVALRSHSDNSATEAEDRVPALGKIPFLHRFFKGNADKREKKNLMILVRPEITTGAE